MERLRIEAVDKVYGFDEPVLNDISLNIRKGEFLVLVGPSGCGKSTLLRIIAGLDKATKGSIFVDGHDITDMTPADRNLAMVFQDYALYPSMTVRENLSFGLKMRKRPKAEIEPAVQKAAKILNITHLLDRKPKQLSGGQRQRVAIGRAIVRDVDIFLFDEPLSNLDASLRSQMRIELASLHKKLGATSVYVTHDQVEAMTLADRIAVLNKGVIQQLGTPDELYSKPQNKFVASFIGSPSMNFFDGKLESSGDKLFFVSSGGKIDVTGTISGERTSCTLGVRPEDIKILTHDGRESEGKMDFMVPMVHQEGHGHETHMVSNIFEKQAIIRSANPFRREVISKTEVGKLIPAMIDRKAIHWFDREGQRLN